MKKLTAITIGLLGLASSVQALTPEQEMYNAQVSINVEHAEGNCAKQAFLYEATWYNLISYLQKDDSNPNVLNPISSAVIGKTKMTSEFEQFMLMVSHDKNFHSYMEPRKFAKFNKQFDMKVNKVDLELSSTIEEYSEILATPFFEYCGGLQWIKESTRSNIQLGVK